MPANIVASTQQRKSALQTPFVCSVEKLRCSAPVRITPCHSARLTLKGSRAVATGGAFRAAGRRTRGKGSLFVFAPAGRWTAILRPAGAGGVRRYYSTGSVRLWRTPPVATALGPVGAEHGGGVIRSTLRPISRSDAAPRQHRSFIHCITNPADDDTGDSTPSERTLPDPKRAVALRQRTRFVETLLCVKTTTTHRPTPEQQQANRRS